MGTQEARILSILKNAGTSGFSRIIATFSGLALIPLAVGYLGTERYGIWVTISSLVAVLQLIDFGIGNALIKLTADNNTKRDKKSLACLVISSFLVLATISVIFLIVSLLIIANIDLNSFLNFSHPNVATEAQYCLYTFVTIFALNFPLTICQPIRLGLQQGYKNGIYNSFGYLVNFLAIFIATQMEASLSILTTASMIGTIGCNLLNIINMRKLLSNQCFRWYDLGQTTFLFIKRSRYFFVLQIFGIISYNLDNIVIATYLDPSYVSEYAMALKIFSLPNMILTLFFSGLWAAYADADGSADGNWIREMSRRAFKVSLIFSTITSLLMLIAAPWLIYFLSQGLVTSNYLLFSGMAIWGILSAIGGATASLLNGLHEIKLQTIMAFIGATINISLSIALTKVIGVSGPIWGTIISLGITYPILIIHANRITTRKSTSATFHPGKHTIR